MKAGIYQPGAGKDSEGQPEPPREIKGDPSGHF
jgi:hypothetical protein